MANSLTSDGDYTIFSLVGYRKSIHKLPNPDDGHVYMTSYNKHNSDFKKKKVQSTLMVVAIDLGTTFSGYSVVFTKDNSQIRYMRNGQDKVPTVIMLNNNKELHSFGHDAQSNYYNLESKETAKFYYFEHFKMALHDEQGSLAKLMLQSSNGRQLSAKVVFTLSLKYLCQLAISEISDQIGFQLSPEDITWVITVPAIWSEGAKAFMRKAAVDTTLVNDTQLYIALEPEVASVYCRKTYHEEQSRKSNIDLPICLKTGTNYVIIDAGGGSVDLTFHQILPKGHIQEVKKSTGLPCGSLKINEKFEKLLASTMGSELWGEFISKHATSYIHLMNSFEARKREVRADHKKSYNIALPYGFIQFFNLKNIEEKFKSTHCPKGLRYSSKLGIIRIDASLMQQLFASVVEPMRRHIKREINTLLVNRSIKYAFLVGGFAQSSVLRHKLKSALEPETQLIIPPSPHLAVLHGAALFGLNPEIIRMRRALRTYGIAVFDRFDPKKHPSDAKVVLQNGEKWVCDVFDRFVTINQPVGLFETITRRYSPVMNRQSFCILSLYSTEQETVTFVTELGVKKCGELRINLQPGGENVVNPAIEKLFKREIEVEMLFGQSEIKITVRDELGKVVKSSIDFHST